MSNDTKAWMPLWIGDYLADTMHLDAEAHGAYLLLIMHYWRSGQPLPNCAVQLTHIARLSGRGSASVLSTVLAFFEVDGETYRHRRIDEELNKSANLKEAQRQRTEAARAAREAKRKAATEDVTKVVTETVTEDVTRSPSPSPSVKNPPTPHEGELDLGSEDNPAVPSQVEQARQLWNELQLEYPNLPKALGVDGPTKRALRARLKTGGLETFKKALRGIASSEFHRMDNPEKWNGMTLGWLAKAANYEKMLERSGNSIPVLAEAELTDAQIRRRSSERAKERQAADRRRDAEDDAAREARYEQEAAE